MTGRGTTRLVLLTRTPTTVPSGTSDPSTPLSSYERHSRLLSPFRNFVYLHPDPRFDVGQGSMTGKKMWKTEVLARP